ncbi:MAG: hypothetical protein AAF583_15695 [Pseudomonadota bacterium]
MIELISLGVVALMRGVLFPDFGSLSSILAIHFGVPIAIAAICVHFAPDQRNRPSWRYFNKGVYFLLGAEIVGLLIYALRGGLPNLLGADFTPGLIVQSVLVQLCVFYAAVHWFSGFKYARAQ